MNEFIAFLNQVFYPGLVKMRSKCKIDLNSAVSSKERRGSKYKSFLSTDHSNASSYYVEQ